MARSDEALARRLGVACRAVGRAGLAHAYGHCSARIDAQEILVSPAKPLLLVSDRDQAVRVPVDGPLPEGALPEVRLHQQVYRRRADVGGIVRFQSPKLMSLSTLGRVPEARHGLGSYFAPRPPFWPDPRLARDDATAAAIAATLGNARAIVLRGNGAVAVGRTLEEAAVLAWFLEDAARVELDVLATGEAGLVYTPEEARDRAVTSGRLFERMWEWLSAADANAYDNNPRSEGGSSCTNSAAPFRSTSPASSS